MKIKTCMPLKKRHALCLSLLVYIPPPPPVFSLPASNITDAITNPKNETIATNFMSGPTAPQSATPVTILVFVVAFHCELPGIGTAVSTW